MTELPVRRLLVDLEAPVARHWLAGDAFKTALFNALSMSFPFGEQFFIDSIRKGIQALPEADQHRHAGQAQGFIGQEATHRRVHSLFNTQIEKHGLVNQWEPRARERLRLITDLNPRHWLAITAATEHITAIFADWMLSHPELLEGSEDRLKTMWLWHSAEESEHKCTAFDLYLALGGSNDWRVTWFNRISLVFLTDLLRQTLSNLHRDGSLWRWQTWTSGISFVLGRNGLLRSLYRPWRAYKQAGFHPMQLHSALSEQWLAANHAHFVAVRSPAAAAA